VHLVISYALDIFYILPNSLELLLQKIVTPYGLVGFVVFPDQLVEVQTPCSNGSRDSQKVIEKGGHLQVAF
jgi:hypothetical protein